MLPRAHRLSRSAEFGLVVRRGSRAGSATVVVHEQVRADDEPVRVGFVVSRAVGNAVARNLVKRRLRHLMAASLDVLAPHSSVVVRANPPAARASYDVLAHDLARCLSKLAARRRVTTELVR